MSQSSFLNFARKHSEYRDVWNAISEYRKKYPTATYIPARQVVRAARKSKPLDVYHALQLMTEAGISRRIFLLMLPDTGEVVGDQYESVGDVPEVVDGTFDQRIDTRDADVVSCYTLSD